MIVYKKKKILVFSYQPSFNQPKLLIQQLNQQNKHQQIFKMNSFSLLLLTLALFSAVSADIGAPGGWNDVDSKDFPELLKTLKSFESEYPAKLNTTLKLYFRTGDVLSAKNQVVNGVKTSINFELFYRPCEDTSVVMFGCLERKETCTAAFFSDAQGKKTFESLVCPAK